MNREIDRQIAELMGIDVERYNGIYLTNGARFSEDWSAMQHLVEWLQGNHYRINLNLIYANEVDCTISKFRGSSWREVGYSGYVESAPLALCNAVLSLPAEVLQDA